MKIIFSQPQARQGTRKRLGVWSLVNGCVAAAALSACAVPGGSAPALLPVGFVHLTARVPDALQDMHYHGTNNFVGRPVAAYEAPHCILSEPAARALQAAQAELRPQGMTLKVFDCYRPQAAVDDFVRWGRDLADQTTKPAFYPDVPKEELFKRGYIAEKSGHSRGSTVDLTAVVLNAQRALLQRHGFRNLPEEWWHYTLQNEPYPETYFNFSVR